MNALVRPFICRTGRRRKYVDVTVVDDSLPIADSGLACFLQDELFLAGLRGRKQVVGIGGPPHNYVCRCRSVLEFECHFFVG